MRRAGRRPARARRVGALARRGPWRIAVVEGSMRPAIEPGDWLLVDPTVAHWPRRGSLVVFHEPESGGLAIKRVAGRPGDWVPFAGGWIRLGDHEAWLLGDATDDELAAAGRGQAVDSRRYGPVPLHALVARAWFRYWPPRRIGRIAPAPADLLERGGLTVGPADDAASPPDQRPTAAGSAPDTLP